MARSSGPSGNQIANVAPGGVKYVSQCKVCNSKFKGVIERLSINGMNAARIYAYLQSLTEPTERAIVMNENIGEGAIRRHLERHFNYNDQVTIKVAESRQKLEESKRSYQDGVSIVVDKINNVSYLIEAAMLKMDQVEMINDPIKEHTLTINYMEEIRKLIETLSKLTGDLKQEGVIDINFFSVEITKFADIVLSTIRQIDNQLNMNGTLEREFANTFKQQWDAYLDVQQRKINGELSINAGNAELNVNTFNDSGN